MLDDDEVLHGLSTAEIETIVKGLKPGQTIRVRWVEYDDTIEEDDDGDDTIHRVKTGTEVNVWKGTVMTAPETDPDDNLTYVIVHYDKRPAEDIYLPNPDVCVVGIESLTVRPSPKAKGAKMSLRGEPRFNDVATWAKFLSPEEGMSTENAYQALMMELRPRHGLQSFEPDPRLEAGPRARFFERKFKLESIALIVRACHAGEIKASDLMTPQTFVGKLLQKLVIELEAEKVRDQGGDKSEYLRRASNIVEGNEGRFDKIENAALKRNSPSSGAWKPSPKGSSTKPTSQSTTK